MQALSVLLTVAASVVATEAAVRSTPPAARAVLQKWEAAARATKTVRAEITLIRTDHVTRRPSEFTGTVMGRKPNQGRLELKTKPAAGEKVTSNNPVLFVWTGEVLNDYDVPGKTMRSRPIRPDSGYGSVSFEELKTLGVSTKPVKPWLFEFVAGHMTAAKFATRYAVRLTRGDDPNYVYLEMKPRTAAGRADFDPVAVVLYRSESVAPELNYQPRTVVFDRSGGTMTERWDFTTTAINAEIGSEYFVPAQPPRDWKVIRIEEVMAKFRRDITEK